MCVVSNKWSNATHARVFFDAVVTRVASVSAASEGSNRARGFYRLKSTAARSHKTRANRSNCSHATPAEEGKFSDRFTNAPPFAANPSPFLPHNPALDIWTARTDREYTLRASFCYTQII